MSIEQRTLKTITHLLGMNESDVTMDSTRDSIGTDSLDDVEIIMALEEEFEIEIRDDECEKLGSVKQAAELVAKKLSA